MDGGVVYRHFCNAGQTRTSCFGVWGSGLFGIGLGNALLDDGINLFGAGVDNIVDHMLVIISRTGNLSFGTAQALLNDFLRFGPTVTQAAFQLFHIRRHDKKWWWNRGTSA